MALTYDSLQSLIQAKYMPVLVDNIFVKSHPLAAILKKKSKTFSGREIGIPIEYAEAGSGNVVWGTPGSSLTPTVTDPVTLAVYNPAMLTGTLKVTEEEFLIMNTPEAVKNIISTKVKNLQKTLEKEFATNLWAATTASGKWNTMPTLVKASGTVGGIAVADFAGWVSPVIDAEALFDSAGVALGVLTEGDLYDADSQGYLPKMLARGIAKAKKQTGDVVDLIVVSQYLWDVLESILDPRKTGNKMDARLGTMGFNALDFRGKASVVSDDDIPVSSNKSSMYFLNSDYLYMFFNKRAKFKAGKFIESDTANTHSMKVHCYGNLVISNRAAHCIISNVYTDSTYV